MNNCNPASSKKAMIEPKRHLYHAWLETSFAWTTHESGAHMYIGTRATGHKLNVVCTVTTILENLGVKSYSERGTDVIQDELSLHSF
eukprot:scaffold1036_cov93-Cylindrotheca_fusiformis.AAC.10